MSGCIYLLSDRRPGHFNQTAGLARYLPDGSPEPETLLLGKPRKAVKRLALLICLLPLVPWLLRLVYRLYYRAAAPALDHPQLLVSTGGDTLVANLILARLNGCPNVFIGRRSFFTDRRVRLVVTTAGRPVDGRVIVLPFAPVNVAPTPAPATRELPLTIAVLMGGDSNEYRWDATDYADLAESLNRLCHRTPARLLITTSRRTGEQGETLLRENLDAACIAEATWYGVAPAPTAMAYCRRADLILCSEDSGTMLTESMAHEKPVVMFHPRNRHLSPFYSGFLKKLESRGVVGSSIQGVSALDVETLAPTRWQDMGAVKAALHRLLESADRC